MIPAMDPKDAPKPDVKDDTLALASLYLASPVAGAHSITMNLGPEVRGTRKGTVGIDPNRCALDDWGDRVGCTKMAIRVIDVKTTRMRTLDPLGQKRVLHSVHSDMFERAEVNLIEYEDIGLWYLVYSEEDDGRGVVPLFDPVDFQLDPSGVVVMKYGMPMKKVLEGGDVEAMKREIATVREALAGLGKARGPAVDDAHVKEVRDTLAELEAAVAKLKA